MKKYPSIDKKQNFDVEVIGFDKLYGSNIRAFWTAKEQAFVKFGTRKLPLTEEHPILG